MPVPAFPRALLPAKPNLDQLRRQAKELRRQHAHSDPAALAEAKARMPEQQGPLTLSAAQCVVARRYSFRSWPRLVHFIDTCDTQGITVEATSLRAAIDGDRLAEIERPIGRPSRSFGKPRGSSRRCTVSQPTAIGLCL